MHSNLVYLFPAGSNKTYVLNPSDRMYMRDILSPELTRNVWGSVLLKTLMHARIVEAYKPDNWTQLCTNSAQISNSFVIVHKLFFDQYHLLEQLKKNNNILICDVIDGCLNDFSFVDAILCCSHKAYHFYKRTQPNIPTLFVEHCADIRLATTPSPKHAFSGYYFGSPDNFLMYNGIFDFIRPCFSNLPHQPVTDWMERLPLANFHYAVRPSLPDTIFKPFTKGVIAALYNSNILIHQDDGDALHYLGADYPYLLKTEPTEKAVVALLQKAKEEFNSKEWEYGLSILEHVKEQYSPKKIAKKFWSEVLSLTA